MTPGTYLVDSTLLIQRKVALEAAVEGSVVVLDGQGKSGEVLHLDAGFHNMPTVSLRGLTVTRGTGANGGGIVIQNGFVDLTACVITGNNAESLGGGMVIYSGTVNIVGCTFSDNSQSNNFEQGGGGFFISGGDIVIIDTVIANNTAKVGPGGGICTSGGNVQLFGCTITGNNAANKGGGGLGIVGGNISVTDSSIFGNFASVEGGGLYTEGGKDTLVRLFGTEIHNNRANNGA